MSKLLDLKSMNLSIGIVGLPNVGKSTLFNSLLKKQVADAANYPFCTIEPNMGIVEVPDKRLHKLAPIVQTDKIVPAAIEFYDIAGLVRGASKGEGLGNKFLAHIREVSAIVHVVRLFESDDIIHVDNTIDPVSDINTIDTELIFTDLATLQKQSPPKRKLTKEEEILYPAVEKAKKILDAGVTLRHGSTTSIQTGTDISLTDKEKHALQQLHLLTLKPVVFLFNVSEEQLLNKSETEDKIKSVLKESGNEHEPYLYLSAQLENDVLSLDEAEQIEFLNQYSLEETGLNRLIQQAYKTLGLISFLTAGEKEVRAWTIVKGTFAPQAAGVIHSDFEKKFIKADIVSFESFIAASGWGKAREEGKVLSAGKDYVMQDGDIVEFKIGR